MSTAAHTLVPIALMLVALLLAIRSAIIWRERAERADWRKADAEYRKRQAEWRKRYP